MNETSSIGHDMECKPLLELATPDIYRRNLFRVLGISVNATPKDVQRKLKRQELQKKLGIETYSASSNPFALNPPPGDLEIRDAMERLNNPVHRVLDEVFWFWPTNGNDTGDAAFTAIETGDIKKAEEIWNGLITSDDKGHIALHNLAVLDHLSVLDHEATNGDSKLKKRELKRIANQWSRVFDRWKKLFEGEEFWSDVRTRVREIDDIQLTTGFVRRVRSTIPTALLLINAKLAYQAAEKSDSAHSRHHIELISNTDFGDGLSDQAINEAIKPIRKRIRIAAENSKRRWEATPHRGSKYVREFYEQAKGLLSTVDLILPKDSPVIEGLHDMMAETMLEGIITFGNKTNDWKECGNLIELPREIAVGEAIRSRLSDQNDVCQDNVEAGNDWCCPGYWDLPEDSLTLLEKLREKATAGDHEGAIEGLAILDPKIGAPLKRCLSYSLSMRGIRIGNDALDEYNQETGVLKKIMDKLRRVGNDEAVRLLNNRPYPEMTYYSAPPCLCCDSTAYKRWYNFTYREIPMFMCSSCNNKQENQLRQQKRVLAKHIHTALEYLLLAHELDSSDPGVRKNLGVVKQTARDIDCSIPNTKALKAKLGEFFKRAKPFTFTYTDEDHICFYCGKNQSDETSQITVPMCGDVQTVEMVFGKGIEFCHGDMIIPRCRSCREEHRKLPRRIEDWHESRLEVVDDENFEMEAGEVAATRQSAQDASASAKDCQKTVDDAKAVLADAESIGSYCESCKSEDNWADGLCKKCDRKLFKLNKMLFGLPLLLSMGVYYFLGYVNADILPHIANLTLNHTNLAPGQILPYVPAGASGLVFVVISFVLALASKRVKKARRKETGAKRLFEINERRKKADQLAQAELGRANAELKSTVQAARQPIEAYKSARKKLHAAKIRAAAAYERRNPKPKLPDGVKEETAYLSYTRLKDQTRQGWGFGRDVTDSGQIVAGEPVDVIGLVSREPRIAKERVSVTCPKCSKTIKVAMKSDQIKMKCACGQNLSVYNGKVNAALSNPRRERYDILAMAREADEEDMLECPICQTKVKARNLVQHYDKIHKATK